MAVSKAGSAATEGSVPGRPDPRCRVRRSLAGGLLAFGTAITLAACSSDPAAVATTSQPPTPLSVETSASELVDESSLVVSPTAGSSATSETPVDKSAETIKDFAARMAKGDVTAKDLTVPGTPLYLYAETAGEIAATNPGQSAPARATKSGSGWNVGGSVNLTDFVMDPSGLIADLSRNGVPVSRIVAPGDGTVYTRTATESYETFTGQVDFTVKAFRLFGDDLQVVIAVDNQSSADAFVGFDSYVANGVQYPQGFNAYGADAGAPTKPTVRRTALLVVTGAPSGGLLTAKPVVDSFSSQDSDIRVTVPNLG